MHYFSYRIGLYLTFRTNYLLRRTKDDSKKLMDTARSALDDEHANFLTQTEYEASPTQLSIETNITISKGKFLVNLDKIFYFNFVLKFLFLLQNSLIGSK